MKVKLKVTQSFPTLWDPMDYIVHGSLQARILEWVAFPFPRWSSQSRDQTQVSHIAAWFFTNWATMEAHLYHYGNLKNYTKMTLFILCNYNSKVWMATYLWQNDLLNVLSHCWDLLLRNRFFSKCYCSLTMHLVTQELW